MTEDQSHKSCDKRGSGHTILALLVEESPHQPVKRILEPQVPEDQQRYEILDGAINGHYPWIVRSTLQAAGPLPESQITDYIDCNPIIPRCQVHPSSSLLIRTIPINAVLPQLAHQLIGIPHNDGLLLAQTTLAEPMA